MLSGRPPFLALRIHEDSAAMIMNRIKVGEFRMDDDLWRSVSGLGKSIVKGLLTVDPKRRLKLEDLIVSPWISQHHSPKFNNNPISSLFVPTPRATLGRIDRQLKQTFNAFHSVAREGGLSQLTAPAPNITVTKVVVTSSSASALPSLQTSRRNLKSSTVSSTTSSSCSSSSGVGGGSSSISISLLSQHPAIVGSHPFIFQPNYSSSHQLPFISEALQGVSTHILPSQVVSSSSGHYPLVSSIYGPMTRLRKRKMAERSNPDQEKRKADKSKFEVSLSRFPMTSSLMLPFNMAAESDKDDENAKKKIKTELNSLPTSSTSSNASSSSTSSSSIGSSYYSVSLTRLPHHSTVVPLHHPHHLHHQQQLLSTAAVVPCSSLSLPQRTFQSTRTPTITID